METKAADKVGHIWSAECPVTAAPEGYEETTVRWTKTRSKQKAPEEEASTLWNALATATEHIKYPELRLIFEVGAKRQAFDFNVPVARGKQTAFGKQLAKLGLNIEVFARKFYHVDDEKKFVFFDDHPRDDSVIKGGKEAVQVTDIVGDTGEVKGDAEALARVEHDTVPASTRASSVTTAALVKPGEAREVAASNEVACSSVIVKEPIVPDLHKASQHEAPAETRESTPGLCSTRSPSPPETARASTPPRHRFPPELLNLKILTRCDETAKSIVLPPKRRRIQTKWVNENLKPIYRVDSYAWVDVIVKKHQRECDEAAAARYSEEQKALLLQDGKRKREDEVSASADVDKLASATGADLDAPPMGKKRRVDS